MTHGPICEIIYLGRTETHVSQDLSFTKKESLKRTSHTFCSRFCLGSDVDLEEDLKSRDGTYTLLESYIIHFIHDTFDVKYSYVLFYFYYRSKGTYMYFYETFLCTLRSPRSLPTILTLFTSSPTVLLG